MIIITGASRGIGAYLLDSFVRRYQRVVGTYNNTLSDKNINLLYKVDITNPSETTSFITSIKDQLDQIVLINCAGNNYNTLSHKADLSKWIQTVNTNLVGTFNMIHAVLPLMREQGYGRIINLSSVVGQKGIAGTSAYAASKSGLWGLTRAIAIENAKKGVTINNINLGYFDIGMITEVPTEILSIIKTSIPMGILGNPVDIFKTVEYLIDCSYITGTSIDLNGGLY